MPKQFTIRWVDAGHEPECQPDPRYPDGIDVDAGGGAHFKCRTALPYPAKRCGHYRVICHKCRLQAVITTAGRPDDPRSVTLACKTSHASSPAKH